jgi:hypothetical protein
LRSFVLLRCAPLTCYLCLSLCTQIRSPSLPPMACNSDFTVIDMNTQQSNRQIYLSRYEARLADYSAVDMDPSPIQDPHDRRMLFDSTCDLDHSVLSPWDSYPHSGFLTPDSFSATSPSPAARLHTSAIHWLPQSGDVPCPPDETNVNMRKERRREQNRMAQRGGHSSFY